MKSIFLCFYFIFFYFSYLVGHWFIPDQDIYFPRYIITGNTCVEDIDAVNPHVSTLVSPRSISLLHQTPAVSPMQTLELLLQDRDEMAVFLNIQNLQCVRLFFFIIYLLIPVSLNNQQLCMVNSMQSSKGSHPRELYFKAQDILYQ